MELSYSSPSQCPENIFTSWLVGLIPINFWWNLTTWFKWGNFETSFYFTEHKSDVQHKCPAAENSCNQIVLSCNKMDSDKPVYIGLCIYHPWPQTGYSLALWTMHHWKCSNNTFSWHAFREHILCSVFLHHHHHYHHCWKCFKQLIVVVVIVSTPASKTKRCLLVQLFVRFSFSSFYGFRVMSQAVACRVSKEVSIL